MQRLKRIGEKRKPRHDVTKKHARARALGSFEFSLTLSSRSPVISYLAGIMHFSSPIFFVTKKRGRW